MDAKVSIVRCSSYQRDQVFKAVQQAIDLLGGIERFVKKNQKVLLKPNMLSAKAPERGITTHPLILEALINLLQPLGAEIWIGDSPSGGIKGIQRCWDNTGYSEVAKRSGVKLINFEAGVAALIVCGFLGIAFHQKIMNLITAKYLASKYKMIDAFSQDN